MATGTYYIDTIQTNIGNLPTAFYSVDPQTFDVSKSESYINISEPSRNDNYNSSNMPVLQGSTSFQISLRYDGPKGIWANAPQVSSWDQAEGAAITIFSYGNINVKAARYYENMYIFFYNTVTHGYLCEWNLSYVGSYNAYTIVFIKATIDNIEYILPYWIEGNGFWFGHQGSNSYNLTHYSGPVPAIVYEWESWPQLSGNNGMFLMDLSKIDDSIIGDGSTVYETFDSSLFDLNSLTDLYTMTINLLNAQETTIAYCGDNYLTATKRTTLVNNVTTVYVTLKFYFRSDVLIYTSPELTVYSSDGAVSRDYLSIMYDEANEVAAPNIIQLWTATGKYGINEYSLPSDEQMRALFIWLQDNGVERETISPYDIGTTDTGGDPNTPTPQDHITDSDLPTLSGLNLGVVTLYLPTTEQLQAIASFLWSDNVLDNFKKYFNNFADNLLNLFVLPYHPSGLLTRTFKVGNMVSEVTDVEYTTQRFYDVDMGSINIEKLWDSYLDFSPYTKIEIFLPYLGLHSLDIDEIMCPARMDGTLQRGLGSVLSLVYRIDVLTGVIVAKIKINGEIRYQFEGRVGTNIPLTGQTYASMVQGIITAGAGLISTVATGGLTAPLSAAAAVTGTINASKPTVERIGNISGDASMLATNVPYVVITRPNKPMLEEQEKYTGFPSYKSGTLNNFTGLTICEDVHVEGISCTEEERNAIVDWLKNGVIL